jgi:hypothetical protein
MPLLTILCVALRVCRHSPILPLKLPPASWRYDYAGADKTQPIGIDAEALLQYRAVEVRTHVATRTAYATRPPSISLARPLVVSR